MQRIVYGWDTKSLEDPEQVFLLDLDSRFDELDSGQTVELILTTGVDEVPWQHMVGLEDVLAAVRGALVNVDCSSVDDVVSEVRREMLARRRDWDDC